MSPSDQQKQDSSDDISDKPVKIPLDEKKAAEILWIGVEPIVFGPIDEIRPHTEEGGAQEPITLEEESQTTCTAHYVADRDELHLRLRPLYWVRDSGMRMKLRTHLSENAAADLLRTSTYRPSPILHKDGATSSNLGAMIFTDLALVRSAAQDSLYKSLQLPESCAVEYDPHKDQLHLTIGPLHKTMVRAICLEQNAGLTAEHAATELRLDLRVARAYLEALRDDAFLKTEIRYQLA